MRFLIVFLLVFVSIQNRATGTLRCASADLSNLARAVYVSPQGNDIAGCGRSTASPCKTIQQGIANCSAEKCGVLVRYGVYNTGKPIDVVDGVSLYGSCVFDETQYRYRSTVIGNPAIQATGIHKPTVIEGFVFLAGAALNTGQASIAFAVSNSTGLDLRENVIASGKGTNGANSNTPSAGKGQDFGSVANATTGGAGGAACPSNPPLGSTGSGGKGASLRPITSTCYLVFCTCGDRNEAPTPVGGNGMNSGSVLGGVGGPAGTPGCACSISGKVRDNAGNGSDGGSGNMGAPATQGGSPNPDTKGSFAGTTWQPNLGGTGAAGQVGSGGGGGGAGGFAALPASGTNTSGFAGGGGGGGGCGGPGGTAGQQGGASVPLVVFASSLTGLADSNAVIPGPGGQGGTGGTGAPGGTGGSGGSGYRGPQKTFVQGVNGVICRGTVPGIGGRGGIGGQGGAGAGGAGGNGGPSFGIALVNSSSVSASNFIIYRAQPGAGGERGTGGQNGATNRGANGEPGSPGFYNDQNSIVSFTSRNLSLGANQ